MAKSFGQTKTISSDGSVTTVGKSGVVHAITLISGTTDSKISISDGGVGGTLRWILGLDGTTAAGETTISISFGNYGFICATDIFANITGTNARAYVLYDEIED